MGDFISKNWLSLFALTLSTISLGHSIYQGRKDRAKLVTTMRFFEYKDTKDRGVYVKAVNEGRRPIILTTLFIKYDTGAQGGTVLGHPNGITLKEQEFWEERYDEEGNSLYRAEDDETAIDMWLVDSRGKKYHFKNSKKHLEAIWKNPVVWKK